MLVAAFVPFERASLAPFERASLTPFERASLTPFERASLTPFERASLIQPLLPARSTSSRSFIVKMYASIDFMTVCASCAGSIATTVAIPSASL